MAPFSPSHLRISRIATRIFPCAYCSWLLPARAFLLGEVAFPRREKVSRRRSVRACLAGRASPTTPASSASLYSQLLSFIPLYFFFLFHTSALYPSSSSIALRPHCGIDRKTSPVSLLSAGRHVYHGSAIPLSPLTSGLQHNGEAACISVSDVLPKTARGVGKKKTLFVSPLKMRISETRCLRLRHSI